MPNEHINFQAMHKTKGMVRALAEHIADIEMDSPPHMNTQENTQENMPNRSIEEFGLKFNTDWKTSCIFKGQITLESIMFDSFKVEDSLPQFAIQVSYMSTLSSTLE